MFLLHIRIQNLELIRTGSVNSLLHSIHPITNQRNSLHPLSVVITRTPSFPSALNPKTRLMNVQHVHVQQKSSGESSLWAYSEVASSQQRGSSWLKILEYKSNSWTIAEISYSASVATPHGPLLVCGSIFTQWQFLHGGFALLQMWATIWPHSAAALEPKVTPVR